MVRSGSCRSLGWGSPAPRRGSSAGGWTARTSEKEARVEPGRGEGGGLEGRGQKGGAGDRRQGREERATWSRHLYGHKRGRAGRRGGGGGGGGRGGASGGGAAGAWSRRSTRRRWRP